MLSVEILRGDTVESCHVVRAAAATVDGVVTGEAERGDGTWQTFMRSAAKPFQAAPAAAADVMGRLGLTDAHLAVGCSSHNGSAGPVSLVRDILSAAGLTDFHVHTGDDGQGGLVKHQCSGNHALALATCVVNGWPTDTYLDRAHPLQVAMQAAVSGALGMEPQVERDNCGMPTHRAPLGAIATAYARLGVGWDGVDGLDRVAEAMRSNPYVIREKGQIDAELMSAEPRLVSKVGAEAILGVGSTAGVGVAARIVDGGYRAWGPAGVAVVRRWLEESISAPPLDVLANPTLFDGGAQPIGSMRAVWADGSQ